MSESIFQWSFYKKPTGSENTRRPRILYIWRAPGDMKRYQIDSVSVKARVRKQIKKFRAYPSTEI